MTPALFGGFSIPQATRPNRSASDVDGGHGGRKGARKQGKGQNVPECTQKSPLLSERAWDHKCSDARA